MSVLSDKWIKKMVKNHSMISPFVSKQTRRGKISFYASEMVYFFFIYEGFVKFIRAYADSYESK